MQTYRKSISHKQHCLMPQTEIQIEKGIPLIPKCGCLHGQWLLLLQKMDVGDSFVVNTQDERDCVLRVNTKTHNIRVTTRKINGIGYRIWRIK